MAFGTTPKGDSGSTPIAEVYVPGSALIALRGTLTTTTDGSSNTSAGVVVGRFTGAVYTRASSAATVSGSSGDLIVQDFAELAVDINISAVSGTTPSIQFFVDRKGGDGVYYQIYNSTSLTTTGVVSTSVGAGCATAQAFGTTARLRWTIAGTSPSFTFSASIIGK